MSLGLIKEYNPEWLDWFNEIKKSLVKEIDGLYLSIEHVGSTAIIGMSAKPIIDIDIVIKRDKFFEVRKKLEECGYIHQGDLGIPGREAFDLIDKEKREQLPEHHLYVCYEGEFELKKHLAFRDYLIKNKYAMEQLRDFKIELDRICCTRQEYIEKKDSLYMKLTTEALMEYDK